MAHPVQTSNASRFCGVVHRSSTGERVHLSLEEARAKVMIVDVSARVTLTQIYRNASEDATSRAKYVFPVPARAAVCAFEMHTEDGRMIKGISKDSTQAKEEYENAVRDGKTAGLVEWVTDDVFTISIGSIAATENITIKLVFVMDLMNDEVSNQIRFQLPMYVGERYGQLPAALVTAAAATTSTRMRITADIQTSGNIQSVVSPTHTISQEPYIKHSGRPSRRRLTAKFRSRAFLEHDFVLTVLADDLDAPRCFVELGDQTSRHDGTKTIAMQLTLIPKIVLPPLPAQEYLFLVDRSGSMLGSPIATAKRTLAMLLRMLPSHDTRFNIFSFGFHSTSLWSRSEPYTSGSLDVATTHVDSMGADYGGTEILAALKNVLSCRDTKMPTAVFVLTDGNAYDTDQTLDVVQAAVAAAPHSFPLRVFTLGIGEAVSQAMCEGIARVGNGECLFAVRTESIVGKCARLLGAGRARAVENVTIDWGIPANLLYDSPNTRAASVSFSRHLASASRAVSLFPPAIRQSPSQIPRMYAGMRFTVFVILTLKRLSVPQKITLRGQLNDRGGPFEVNVPVMKVQFAASDEITLPLVHTLAARRLITDTEEGRAPLPRAVGSTVADDIRKSTIIDLGEEYQLASRYTSFVAVDLGSTGVQRDRQGRTRDADGSPTSTTGDPPKSIWDYIQTFFVPGTARNSGSGASTSSISGPPGAWTNSTVKSAPSPNLSHTALDEPEPDTGYESASTFSSLSSLEGSYSEWSESLPPSPRPQTRSETEYQRSPSPQFEPLMNAPDNVKQNHVNVQPPQAPPIPPLVPEVVVELVRLQLFDGSFPLNASFTTIVGSHAAPSDIPADSGVWATALAVAFMKKHLGNQPDLLDNLITKVMEFVKTGDCDNFDELVRRADNLVV